MTKSDNVIRAFSGDQATKIVGMSDRILAYWDKTGFFKPSFATIGDGRLQVRVYSFRDLVSLRTLRILRDRHKVSLQHLRIVLQKLSEYSNTPFADLTLRVHGREVHFDEPETGRTRGVVSGQYTLLPIIDVMSDVNEAADRLTKRVESDFGKTEQHRNVNHNVRVISGTRVPVRAIRRFLEAGYTSAQIISEYPSITIMDVEAVKAELDTASAA